MGQHSDTDAMEAMRKALGNVEVETNQSLQYVNRSIDSMRRNIADREKLWQTRLELAKSELEQAQYALAACYRSGDAEHPPDCRGYEQAVYDAQRKVQQYQQNVDTCKVAARTFEAAVQEYDGAAQRYSGVLSSNIAPAQSYIHNHNIAIDSMPAHGGSISGTGSRRIVSEPPQITHDISPPGIETKPTSGEFDIPEPPPVESKREFSGPNKESGA